MVTLKNLGRKSIAAVAWNFVGGGGRALAQIFIQTVLARILGPEVFGQYAIVLAIFSIGWLLADGGFGAALIQKDTVDDKDIGRAIGWVFLTAMFLGMGVYFSAAWISMLFNNIDLIDVVRVTAVLIFLQALTNIPSSLMRRNLDAKRLQIIQLSGYIFCFGLVGVWLAKNGFGIWSLVISFLLQTIFSLISMYLCVRHTLRPCFDSDKKFGKFGLNVVGVNILNWAIENVDRMLVGRIWGVSSLGQYSVALNLSRAPVNILINAVQSVAFSSASKVKNDFDKLRNGYLILMNVAMLLALPLFTYLSISAEFVIHTVYGEAWIESAILFRVFSICMPMYIVISLTGPVLWSLGSVNKELHVQLLALILMVFGFFLLSNFSIKNAIWFLPVLYAMRSIFIVVALLNKIKINVSDLIEVFRGGLIFSCVIIIASYCIDLFDVRGGWIEIMRIGFCLFLCLVALFSSKGFLFGSALNQFLIGKREGSRVFDYFLKFSGV